MSEWIYHDLLYPVNRSHTMPRYYTSALFEAYAEKARAVENELKGKLIRELPTAEVEQFLDEEQNDCGSAPVYRLVASTF